MRSGHRGKDALWIFSRALLHRGTVLQSYPRICPRSPPLLTETLFPTCSHLKDTLGNYPPKPLKIKQVLAQSNNQSSAKTNPLNEMGSLAMISQRFYR